MTIRYRNINGTWYLCSTARLVPGAEAQVTKRDNTTKTETVGGFLQADDFGFYYCVATPTAAPVTAAKVGDLSGILALFNSAKQHLKYPAIVLGLPALTDGIRISVAGERARFPGSLTVVRGEKPEDGERRGWLGRVHRDGTYEPAPAERGGLLSRAIEKKLREFAAEPARIAAEHGRLTGRCCFCNRALTDERSTAVGYGQTCAGHFGLTWGRAHSEPSLPFKAPPASLMEMAASLDAQS